MYTNTIQKIETLLTNLAREVVYTWSFRMLEIAAKFKCCHFYINSERKRRLCWKVLVLNVYAKTHEKQVG